MINANVKLPARYFTTNPAKPFSEMGITDVKVRMNKLNIGSGMATYGPWSEYANMTYNSADDTFNATLNLEENSIYAMEWNATNASGSKKSRIIFIDTADETTYYRADYRVIQGSNAIPVPGASEKETIISDALVIITPPTDMEFPKWLPGLKNSIGNPTYQENPTEGVVLYQYAVEKESDVTIELTTNDRGHAGSGYLQPGTYGIQITKTGYSVRSSTFTITSSNLSGNWSLNKN